MPVTEQHYKKTYLVRKQQEQEAKEEIGRFEHLPTEYPENDSDYNQSSQMPDT